LYHHYFLVPHDCNFNQLKRFGIKKEEPSNSTLNYIGVFLALLSIFFYLFVNSNTASGDVLDPESSSTTIATNEDDEENLVNETTTTDLVEAANSGEDDIIDRLHPFVKRALGTVLAVITGILFGQSNTPILYANEHFKIAGNYLDYLFSFYLSIFFTTLGLFVIYTLLKKNKPDVYPQIILPALISGKNSYK
jgi:hypothetical protein